jgi:hemin uptake protein HemP
MQMIMVIICLMSDKTLMKVNEDDSAGTQMSSSLFATQSVADLSVMSEQLFAGRRELIIRHMGQVYRLRQTQQGKLILTK